MSDSNGSGGNGEQPRRPINIEINMQPYPSAPPPDMSEFEPEDDGRPSKELELAEAIERYVPDGIESLAVGGMFMHNNPMALVRELIRQKKHIKQLITSPGGCINADLLIGAGLVEEIVTSYVGFEHLGLAPAFRRAAQSGQLRVYELDAHALMQALRAGANDLPFVALPPGLALSDVSRTNPTFYKTVTDPFTGQPRLVVPALKPQVALVAAQQADKTGNLLFKGSVFSDRDMLMAARVGIVQVESIISTEQLTRQPLQVSLPAYYTTAVVMAQFSCHPTACHRYYHYDEDHLKEYLQLAATPQGFDEYRQKYLQTADEVEYLSKTSVASG